MAQVGVSHEGDCRLEGEFDGQANFWTRATHMPTGITVEWDTKAGTMDKRELVAKLMAAVESVRQKETKLGSMLDTASEPILQFFDYGHLPPHLQNVSMWFRVLARRIVEIVPRNPERTVALRKLLEAKDAAVRAAVFK